MDEKGVIVSTIYDEAILVRIIYAEEGFLPAHYLGRIGVAQGNRFETI
jgi:hypothetical protein